MSVVDRTLFDVSVTPFQRATVDGVPVIFVTPDAADDRHQLARLADVGFTAISFDPYRLGERGDGDDRLVMESVFAHFRRHMWPILGHTTLDAVRVLDWATERFPVRPDDVVAGGLSMGGDISVALAGIDHRVTRVSAVVAAPDWTRPGMTHVGEPGRLIDQGEPTFYGQWLFSHLDPATHPHHYVHGPAIAFELGADDTHVPPKAARLFHDALRATAPLAAERMRVTEHAGLDHLGAARADHVVAAAIDWLAARP